MAGPAAHTPDSGWTRRDLLAGLLTFAAALAGYLLTLPPSITLEDAGELAAAAHHLGVPHPPGYPLWTFLTWFISRPFQFLTWQGYPNPAWGITFASALFGALACAITAALLCRVCRNTAAAFTPGPGILHPRLRAWTAGLLPGLLLPLALHTLPGPALLLTFLLALLISALILPCRLPTPATRSAATLGLLLGLTAYFTAWNLLPVPSPLLVLPLALLLAAAALALLALGDRIAARIARTPVSPDHLRAARPDLLCGLAGGLLLAFSPLMWSQSVIIEVYSLNALFTAALAALAYDHLLHPRPRTLLTATFLFALGLTNHHALAFLAPFLLAILAAIPRPQRLLPLRLLPALLGLTLLGLGFNAFMPLASEQNPPMNWGNARTPDGFVHMITRGQYAGFGVTQNLQRLLDNARAPLPPELLDPERAEDLARHHRTRTHLARQLGALLWNPASKFSIASQFSWQFPRTPPQPGHPLPPDHTLPLALLAFVPLLLFTRLNAPHRAWIHATSIALFSLAVLFLLIQNPRLDTHDLFVKRVQYLPAHLFHAFAMGLGAFHLTLLAYTLRPRPALLHAGGLLTLLLFTALPLHKNARDPAHREFVGTSSQRHHDFGWRYGHHLLQGIDGILHDNLPLFTPADTYPPPLEPGAILFGGTDPGRFIPTYLIHSVQLRPDITLLTQNALADTTYLETLRDLHGHHIFTPSALDNHRAFRSYADHLRIFDPQAFAALMQSGDTLAVSGVDQVNHINFHLTRLIIDRNAPHHPVYLEESYAIPELDPHLRIHGLLFKVEPHPVRHTPDDIRRDMDFWDRYTATLLETHLPPEQRSGRFQADAMARRAFSKLRSSQARVYQAQGHPREADRAFRQAHALYPANPETAFLHADLHLSQLRFDAAETLINTFALHDPHHPQLPVFHQQLARLRPLNQRRLRAEADWDLAPGVNLALQLTQLYGHLGMKEHMADAARILLNLPRIREEFYPPLADFLQQEQHLPLYRQTLETWHTRYPQTPEPLLRLAAIALSERDTPRLYQHLDRALALDPALRTTLRQDPRFLDIHHWPGFQQRTTTNDH